MGMKEGSGVQPLGTVGSLLMDLRRRLYLYVALDMVVAISLGNWVTISGEFVRKISVLTVFLMLYLMMVRLAVERSRTSAKNYKLIAASLLYAYGIGPVIVYLVAKMVLQPYPELYAALILVGTTPAAT